MGDVKYRANIRVERIRGPIRHVWLPAKDGHHTFGVHSDIAEHYGVSMEDFPPDATTIDWVIAAAAG
ncbi:MAG: hypothetical protein KJO36_00315 [Acidimicrobiia bacterium]|nr:hypothetical protein [Acidimicrobiia bacterium]MBT8249674.1 hypothetical protein [Acidimicrobiia bacterium]NND13854.1 hypothetical protein [Acidimicrobiia bacterium]NNL27847.1 hypothetical protein [Acidimicrobiia bacterium]NNL48538.1 hypothetical protein [Acidimicrobiia bacterium]